MLPKQDCVVEWMNWNVWIAKWKLFKLNCLTGEKYFVYSSNINGFSWKEKDQLINIHIDSGLKILLEQRKVKRNGWKWRACKNNVSTQQSEWVMKRATVQATPQTTNHRPVPTWDPRSEVVESPNILQLDVITVDHFLCVRECARVCVRACMRACVRACVHMCVWKDKVRV